MVASPGWRDALSELHIPCTSFDEVVLRKSQWVASAGPCQNGMKASGSFVHAAHVLRQTSAAGASSYVALQSAISLSSSLVTLTAVAAAFVWKLPSVCVPTMI